MTDAVVIGSGPNGMAAAVHPFGASSPGAALVIDAVGNDATITGALTCARLGARSQSSGCTTWTHFRCPP